MVAGFRRSLSLPGPKCREKPRHVRSTSLPCRSHPAIAHVEDEIRALRAWLQAGPAAPEARIKTGLDRVELLHSALDGLLALPQAKDTLRRPCGDAVHLLDALLRFADAYGTLRSASVTLSDHASEAHAAIRHRDACRLATAVRSQKKVAREVAQLAAAVRVDAKPSPSSLGSSADAAEVELAGILREVVRVTAAASVAIFSRAAAVSSTASAAMAKSASSRGWWMVGPLKKLQASKEEEIEIVASEKLDGLEECVEVLENGSERVFRSLVISRVSLLNILTPPL